MEDRINLSGIDAATGPGGQAFVLVAVFTGVEGELIVMDFGGGSYRVSGDTDGDASADFSIQVTSATPLISDDFVL